MSNLELQERLLELSSQVREKRAFLRDLFDAFAKVREQGERARALRDEINAKVKSLKEEALARQARRDQLRSEAGILAQNRRSVRGEIKDRALTLSQEKALRDELNRSAPGSSEGLERQIEGALKTLFTLDLSLKEEAILYEMILDLRRRLELKLCADSLHTEMREVYMGIKEAEATERRLSDNIASLHEMAQREHEQSLALFKKRDKLRAEADGYHQAFIASREEGRRIQKEIAGIKKEIDGLREEIEKVKEALSRERMTRADREKAKRLVEAKKKLQEQRKMGLEDLAVLIESGALKGSK